MKVKRYLASNTQEAILKVKMDLGNEALILNTRKVRKKGILSFFSKPMVEVLAAVDSDYAGKKDSTKCEDRTQRLDEKAQEKNNYGKKEEKITLLENKVNNMEGLLQKIYNQLLPDELNAVKTTTDINKLNTGPVQIFYNNLVKNEVDVEIANLVINMVREKVGDTASINDAASVLFNVLSGLFGKPETIKLREDGKPTVIVFVGPTGVGKTTTLAKIAASFALEKKKSVGLITADTYRIAAVEQLKTYAEILGMSVSVAYSASEIREIINSYSDKDLILIDTAGRSHKNKSQFEELKTFIKAAEADEIYLLLSATTSIGNCREIVNNYSFLDDYKMIFTKLDETTVPGIILNARYMTKRSLSYITNGQSVPDDIEIANVDKISKMLLGSIV